MKAIILSAGKGTRLYPITYAIPKALLPIYDRPMIYYSFYILKLLEIKEVLLITQKDFIPLFKLALKDIEANFTIKYAVQEVQRGIADAFLIGEEFIKKEDVALLLSDNIFYHPKLKDFLIRAKQKPHGARVFGKWVKDPRRFGVAEIGNNGELIGIEEKPQNPKTNYMVPGLYFFDEKVVEYAKKVTPSARGELEITSVIEQYINNEDAYIELLPKDLIWFDAGTPYDLLKASNKMYEVIQSGDKFIRF